MTAPRRWITHGLLTVGPLDGKTVVWSGDGHTFVGEVSPWVQGKPDGDWYGKRSGEDAGRFPTRHQALAHVVGGCPGCTCEPVPCATDESGDNCPVGEFCLYGCTEDLRDMRKETP